MSPFISRLRMTVLTALVILSPPLGYAGLHYAGGNIHEVQEGVFFRSGQLDGATLQDLVDREGIRTILNLRGAHSSERWYVEEASIAEGNGIRYKSIAISARSVPEMATMVEIARVLRESPGPILVHCLGGSDRSGLASAIYDLVVRGTSEEEAAGQLSIVYGHFPWLGSRTGAMDEAFARFANYWRTEGALTAASGGIERTQRQ